MKNKFPTPLSNAQWWNPSSYFLPATTLTVASIFIFVFILVRIGIDDELRHIFTLPFYQKYLRITLSIVTIIACFFLTKNTSNRPSPLLARYWTILLTLISASVVYIQALDFSPSWWEFVNKWWPWFSFQNAILLATLIAFFTLSVRWWFKPRIDSPAIQWVTPITLLAMILIATMFFSWFAKTAYENMKAAEQKLKRCNDISEPFEKLIDSQAIIQDPQAIINLLKKQEHLECAKIPELIKRFSNKSKPAKNKALDSIKTLLKPNNLLTTSNASKPVHYYLFSEKSYVQNNHSISTNKKIIQYYQELNTLIEKAKTEIPVSEYKQWLEPVKEQLGNALENWSDHWITFYLHTVFPKNSGFDFSDYLIKTPFITVQDKNNQQRRFSLTDLETIMKTSIRPNETLNLLANTSTCFKFNNSFIGKNDQNYFAISCYAYNPYSRTDMSTVLEVRIIYTAEGQFNELSLILPQTNNPYSIDENTFLPKFESILKKEYPNIKIQYLRTNKNDRPLKHMVKYYGKYKAVYMPYTSENIKFGH